jgi:pimeloyl-ACP methyl ester carboxylesterase
MLSNANGSSAMPTMQLDEITIAYDEIGVGDDVIVFVHGHPFDRSMWSPQHQAVAKAGWRSIAPDLRGYGETSVVPGKTPLSRFAADIVGLADRLGIDRFVIAGLSMGGQIAMELCRAYPERLRGLVLAATFPQAETEEGKAKRRAMADRFIAEGMAPYATEFLSKMIAPRNIAAMPAVADKVMKMMVSAPPEGAAAAMRGRAERPDYRDTLERFAKPALVVVGDEDGFTTRSDAETMHGFLKESRLVWLEGVGHMPNLEREAEFNALLTEFLSEVVAGKEAAE